MAMSKILSLTIMFPMCSFLIKEVILSHTVLFSLVPFNLLIKPEQFGFS